MTEIQSRVNELVKRIERHQEALKMSDGAFAVRYKRHLSSYDSWRRLRLREWGPFGSRLEKWERKLSGMVAEIDGTSDVAEFYDYLPITRYTQMLYDILQGQKTDRRVAWLIGPTGVGKSVGMQRLARDNPGAAAYLHINRGARESLMTLAVLLARAVGATLAGGGAATYMNVVEALKANPITLVIDDVHEGGVLMLKLIKHLVDDTRAKFVLGTYPTAWRMLLNGSTDAHSEAQQLLGRSIKPIERRWEGGVTASDVTAFLKPALPDAAACKVLAGKIVATLQRHGNFRALADAVELARANADDEGGDLSDELIESAIHEICPKAAQ